MQGRAGRDFVCQVSVSFTVAVSVFDRSESPNFRLPMLNVLSTLRRSRLDLRRALLRAVGCSCVGVGPSRQHTLVAAAHRIEQPVERLGFGVGGDDGTPGRAWVWAMPARPPRFLGCPHLCFVHLPRSPQDVALSVGVHGTVDGTVATVFLLTVPATVPHNQRVFQGFFRLWDGWDGRL